MSASLSAEKFSSRKSSPTHAVDPRIISGRFRGQTIKAPHGGTHPMGSREKLALFNMVNVESARILDAYAGSGALGLEALSRGASTVVFVDSQAFVTRIIRENLVKLGLTARIFTEKLAKFAARLDAAGESSNSLMSPACPIDASGPDFWGYFDVIFADPPYDHIDVAELSLLPDLLAPAGVLALSSPVDLGEITLPGLRISSTHTYARARITIYRRAE